MTWLTALLDDIDRHGAVVRVAVVRADGSTPREVGAAMVVSAHAEHGTIGGGALELAAITHARRLLAAGEANRSVPPATPRPRDSLSPPSGERESRRRLDSASQPPSWRRDTRDFPLGPSLGQCCGGFTRLLFEVLGADEHAGLAALAAGSPADALLLRPLDSGAPPCIATGRKHHRAGWPLPVTRAVREMLSGARPRRPVLVRGAKGEPAWLIEPLGRPLHRLCLYGAGHVGRAIVRALQDLPFAVTWVDTSADRFPEPIPPHATAEIAPDPAAFAAAVAEPGAFHLVLTYSHALDLAICHSLLRRADDVRFLGLIGSATKRARFLKRLADLGIGEAQRARLVCPIGIPGIRGKQPAMIAVSVAAQLVQLASAGEDVEGVIPARAALPAHTGRGRRRHPCGK